MKLFPEYFYLLKHPRSSIIEEHFAKMEEEIRKLTEEARDPNAEESND